MKTSDTSDIVVKPNCRCLDILVEIIKKIKEPGIWSVSKLALGRTKEIPKFAQGDFINISEQKGSNKKIMIEEKSLEFTLPGKFGQFDNCFCLFENGFIKFIKFKINGETFSAGAFPLLLEEYFLLSLTITIGTEHLNVVEEIITQYNRFFISEIDRFQLNEYRSDRDFYIPQKNKAIDSAKLETISHVVGQIFFHLGTNTFLKKNLGVDEEIDELIDNFEEYVNSQLKDLKIKKPKVYLAKLGEIGPILMMINMLKYSHFRTNIDPEEEKKKKVDLIPEKIKEKIIHIAEMEIGKSGLEYHQRNQLMHYAYLKALIEGENYNYRRGKEILHKHSLRAAVAAVIGRNMSHNIGSHVLSSISINDIQERKCDVSIFNSYLQQRMDFLARISTDWPATGEFLCFYSDVMRNFLKQSFLLDKIINDDGVKGKRIKFHIKINNSGWFTFHREDDSSDKATEFVIENGRTPSKDLLVHLPGGMMGTQALYVILENVMRNSAKYSKKDSCYNIYIEIEENNELSYRVRVYDNFSVNEKNLLSLLKEKLEKSLIKENGEIIEKDWGIQEIKIAARFLNYPFLEYDIGIPIGKDKKGEKKYICLETKGPHPGGEDVPSRKLEQTVISYEFSIPKARLIMCVEHPKRNHLKENVAKNIGILTASKKDFCDRLKDSSVEMLYFDIAKHSQSEIEEELNKIVEKIREDNHFLPTRIVVSVPGNFIGSIKSNPQVKLSELPPKRLIICPREETQIVADENGVVSEKELERFIIRVYKQWVFRWHEDELLNISGCEKKNEENGDPKLEEACKIIGIVIHFQRFDSFSGFHRWIKLKKDLIASNCQLGNIKFLLLGKKNKVFRGSDFETIEQAKSQLDIAIGFDNHGNIVKEFHPWDFYQIISNDKEKLKMNNHSIFSLLENVPTGFAGAMFVLSLIEAAYTKVGVVDERVANWAFEEARGEFCFKHGEDIPLHILQAQLLISASVYVPNRKQLVGKEKKVQDFKVKGESSQQKEGITTEKGFYFLMGNNKIEKIDHLDLLVIHLGFLEEVFKNDKQERLKEWLKAMEKNVSKIILISGRGYKPEEIPNGLPFREASLVTNYITTDFNKLNLVKGLISTRGERGNNHEQ